MRSTTVVILAFFAPFLLIVLIWLLTQGEHKVITGKIALTALREAMGMFLIAAAGLLLLIRAAAGDAVGRLLGLALAGLVGALLVEPHWSVALGLAASIVGLALRPALGGYTRRMPPLPPLHGPPAL